MKHPVAVAAATATFNAAVAEILAAAAVMHAAAAVSAAEEYENCKGNCE
jgi:hypothetical protein